MQIKFCAELLVCAAAFENWGTILYASLEANDNEVFILGKVNQMIK